VAIVTYQDVKTHLNLTDDGDAFELTRFIDAASDIVEQIVGPLSDSTYTETHDATNRSVLVLNHFPVQSVQSVVESVWGASRTLTAQPVGSAGFGYTMAAESGVMERRFYGGPSRFCGPVTVTYTAGRGSVPAAVQLATLVIVAYLWQTQRGAASLPSVGGEPAPAFVQNGGVPPLALELLRGYEASIPTLA
jgi:hypothetical protein